MIRMKKYDYIQFYDDDVIICAKNYKLQTVSKIYYEYYHDKSCNV